MVELDPEIDPNTLDQLLANAVEQATSRTKRNEEEQAVEVSIDTMPPPPTDLATTEAPKAPDAPTDEIDENW